MEQIKRFRIHRNLTLQQLADKTGIKTGEIHRIENGAKNPTQAQLTKIMKVLDVDFKTLKNA